MTNNDLISLGSLMIAIAAFAYAYLTNSKKYELSSQYRVEVLKWYEKTIELLVLLRAIVQNHKVDQSLKEEYLAKLSSQIEIGRFYFPNIDKGDGLGFEKPSAYKGYRNLMLEFVVMSYQIFTKQDAYRYVKHAEVLQRHFTSHLFETLDPRQYLKHTKKYTNKVFSKDFCLEDFIEQDPGNIKIFYEVL
jgi:hypothetical protein